MLEQLYSAKFLREKPIYAFLLGIAFSVIALGASLLLFPQDPALISVLIISVLFLPSLYKLSAMEEKQEAKEKGFWKSIYNQRQLIKVYFYAFFGILITFAFFSAILPSLATNFLFKQQLSILGSSGGAVFSSGLFSGILSNNIKIMLLCFGISLVLGNGSIFFITWNASVWGTIFGNIAKTGALAAGKSPLIYLILILISVLPQVILEVFSYIFATISGTELSEGFLKERTAKLKKIIYVNLLILVLAFIAIIIAAVVETFVLNNFETYRIIISQAFG